MDHPLPAVDLNVLFADVCQALANSTRILILYTLAAGPKHVNALAQDLNLPQPTVSRHLRILHQQSLVETEREGANIAYRLVNSHVIEVLDTLQMLVVESLVQKTAVLNHPHRISTPESNGRRPSPASLIRTQP